MHQEHLFGMQSAFKGDTMAYDRFLIAPFDENSGLTTNMRPWQVPDQAWTQMDNAYVFRGRVRKRFGSNYMGVGPLSSRLRTSLASGGAAVGITNSSGSATGNVRAITGNSTLPLNQGQFFSIGTQLYTVSSALTGVQSMLTTSGTATFNLTTGDYVITGSSAHLTTIYFYPSLPVMGIAQYEFSSINNYSTFAFDTQFAYTFVNGFWSRSGTGTTPIWHGPDNNFFWSVNWVGLDQAVTTLTRALFVTNFYAVNPNGAVTVTDDNIWYFNNSSWQEFVPYFAPTGASLTGPYVNTCLIILPFHGRLLLFNTIETDPNGVTNTNYVNRVRYSFVGSPFWNNSFYQTGQSDTDGGSQSLGTTAGFLDAATLEAIVSARFIKDRLIVYFEESTWELAYTGNEQQPFEWQKLNDELGSMATFSTIPFDKALLTIGETGVHSCNGSNVQRIDQKIPGQIFEISNPSAEVERICGIRDYFSEMVYWSIPESKQDPNQVYPSRILAYNYQNQTWSFNDDCITAFGYYDGQGTLTWATVQGTWEEWNSTWDTGITDKQVRQIIAGNTEGFVFIIDTEVSVNAAVLQITTMTDFSGGIELTIINHMLKDGDYIYITGAQGVVLNGLAIYVVLYIDKNTILAYYPSEIHTAPTFTGTYTGGGVVARVSNYNLYSKQWNPYDKDGHNVYIPKIDFAVMRTEFGEVTVDYSPSSSPLSTINDAAASNSLTGTSVLETHPYPVNLYPLEQSQQRLWHPIYFQTDGECIQINIYMSPTQICTPNIAFSDFEIEGMIIYSQPASNRLQ